MNDKEKEKLDALISESRHTLQEVYERFERANFRHLIGLSSPEELYADLMEMKPQISNTLSKLQEKQLSNQLIIN